MVFKDSNILVFLYNNNNEMTGWEGDTWVGAFFLFIFPAANILVKNRIKDVKNMFLPSPIFRGGVSLPSPHNKPLLKGSVREKLKRA